MATMLTLTAFFYGTVSEPKCLFLQPLPGLRGNCGYVSYTQEGTEGVLRFCLCIWEQKGGRRRSVWSLVEGNFRFQMLSQTG